MREVGSGWGKVGSCKSPAARKPDTPSSHQPARREVSLLISSFSTSADSQIPPIHMRPAHMRPRHMPSFLDRSLAPLLSKQQAICSLPHGRLRLLRDKRCLSSTVHPLRITKIEESPVRVSMVQKPKKRHSPITPRRCTFMHRPEISEINLTAKIKGKKADFAESCEGISAWDDM